jgi:hypothetical protein
MLRTAGSRPDFGAPDWFAGGMDNPLATVPGGCSAAGAHPPTMPSQRHCHACVPLKHSRWHRGPQFHRAANQSMIDCQAGCGRVEPTTSPNTSAEDRHAMNRTNLLFLVIGALVIVAAVLGYELYQDRKQPEGMQINVGPKGLSIEKK